MSDSRRILSFFLFCSLRKAAWRDSILSARALICASSFETWSQIVSIRVLDFSICDSISEYTKPVLHYPSLGSDVGQQNPGIGFGSAVLFYLKCLSYGLKTPAGIIKHVLHCFLRCKDGISEYSALCLGFGDSLNLRICRIRCFRSDGERGSFVPSVFIQVSLGFWFMPWSVLFSVLLSRICIRPLKTPIWHSLYFLFWPAVLQAFGAQTKQRKLDCHQYGGFSRTDIAFKQGHPVLEFYLLMDIASNVLDYKGVKNHHSRPVPESPVRRFGSLQRMCFSFHWPAVLLPAFEAVFAQDRRPALLADPFDQDGAVLCFQKICGLDLRAVSTVCLRDGVLL